ncbi:MAG: hypothetical protein RLZZ206_1384 [Cyanobacteriota bacterium]|jgi:hypothetical protein
MRLIMGAVLDGGPATGLHFCELIGGFAEYSCVLGKT